MGPRIRISGVVEPNMFPPAWLSGMALLRLDFVRWLSAMVLSVMAGRVPTPAGGPPRRLYNRHCAGDQDTPGHDGERSRLKPGLILMRMGSRPVIHALDMQRTARMANQLRHDDMAPPVRQRSGRLVLQQIHLHDRLF
jgi:hypothetical protein